MKISTLNLSFAHLNLRRTFYNGREYSRRVSSVHLHCMISDLTVHVCTGFRVLLNWVKVSDGFLFLGDVRNFFD